LLFIAPLSVGLTAAQWRKAAVELLNAAISEDKESRYYTDGLGQYWIEYRAHRSKIHRRCQAKYGQHGNCEPGEPLV